MDWIFLDTSCLNSDDLMPKSYFINERLSIVRRSLIANAHRQYIDLRIKSLIKLLMPSGTSDDGRMFFCEVYFSKCVALYSLLATHFISFSVWIQCKYVAENTEDSQTEIWGTC